MIRCAVPRTCHARPARVAALAMLATAMGAASGHAQVRGRWETGGGIRLMGAAGLGRVDAVQTGSDGVPLTLFTTDSELAGSAGWQVSAVDG